MAKLLELVGVKGGYGKSDILKGINLDIDDGEIVGLLGRNGVGKTTTLRCISGQLGLTAGSITFKGEEISNLSANELYKRGIRHVPEDRGMFSNLSVEENLNVPVVRDGDDERSLAELFDYFPRLEERRGVKSGKLSGGEQQMLSIARALRSFPELLLLDEPSEGLAPQIVEKVASIVELLAEQGLPVLIVEQNTEMVFELADRVYIMADGEIVFNGETAEIRNQRNLLASHLGVKASQ